MAKKIPSQTGDAESKRRTDMQVDGESGQAVAPPAELEHPALRFLWIAAMILFGLFLYTMMLITTLHRAISDPCMRLEFVIFMGSVIDILSNFIALLLFAYLMGTLLFG